MGSQSATRIMRGTNLPMWPMASLTRGSFLPPHPLTLLVIMLRQSGFATLVIPATRVKATVRFGTSPLVAIRRSLSGSQIHPRRVPQISRWTLKPSPSPVWKLTTPIPALVSKTVQMELARGYVLDFQAREPISHCWRIKCMGSTSWAQMATFFQHLAPAMMFTAEEKHIMARQPPAYQTTQRICSSVTVYFLLSG